MICHTAQFSIVNEKYCAIPTEYIQWMQKLTWVFKRKLIKLYFSQSRTGQKRKFLFSSWLDSESSSRLSVGGMGARQPVVRHHQTDVVVVAVWLSVVGPADGQDVILWQRIFREVIMADDSPVSGGEHFNSVTMKLNQIQFSSNCIIAFCSSHSEGTHQHFCCGAKCFKLSQFWVSVTDRWPPI